SRLFSSPHRYAVVHVHPAHPRFGEGGLAPRGSDAVCIESPVAGRPAIILHTNRHVKAFAGKTPTNSSDICRLSSACYVGCGHRRPQSYTDNHRPAQGGTRAIGAHSTKRKRTSAQRAANPSRQVIFLPSR